MRTLLSFLVALVVLLPASAQAADKLITVTGQANVAVAPDSVAIRIGVTSRAKTARDASEANAKQMTAVVTAIKGDGIADRDMQTSQLSLQPDYDSSKSGAPQLLGFQASNQLTVKIRDISRLPVVLDHATAAGANEVSGIEFEVSNPSKLLDKARADAIADARRKAELYAQAAGAKLGNVAAISEETAPGPMPRLLGAARGAMAPIAAGEQTLQATVKVSYELAP
jgi:uncharacterized protein